MRDTTPGGDGPEWSRTTGPTGLGPRTATLSITPVPGVADAAHVALAGAIPPPADPTPPDNGHDGNETRRITVSWNDRRYRSVDVPASIPDKDLTDWLSANWSRWYVDEGESDGSEVTGWQADR